MEIRKSLGKKNPLITALSPINQYVIKPFATAIRKNIICSMDLVSVWFISLEYLLLPSKLWKLFRLRVVWAWKWIYKEHHQCTSGGHLKIKEERLIAIARQSSFVSFVGTNHSGSKLCTPDFLIFGSIWLGSAFVYW